MVHKMGTVRKFLTNWLHRGHSQTTFAAMGEGGVHEMSALLNKSHEFYEVKLSIGGSKKLKNRST